MKKILTQKRFMALTAGLFLILIIVSFTVSDQKTLGSSSEFNCEHLMPKGTFSIDTLIKTVQTQKGINSVERILCLIPKSVRSNYVLVHSSKSAQSSSPEYPRAIFYKTHQKKHSYEMKYAISFNGNKSDSNYDHVEIMKVNSHAKKDEQYFEFIDIDCSDPTKNCHVSESNPPECLMCHGVNTKFVRPIWDAKGFFPQAYGKSAINNGAEFEDEDTLAAFKRFIHGASLHPRYSFLEQRSNLEVIDHQIPHLVLSNSIFAEGLAMVNAKRLASLIMHTPDYQSYKYAIFASLNFCPNIGNYVPSHLRNNHSQLNHVEPYFRDTENFEQILSGFKEMERLFENETFDTALQQIIIERANSYLESIEDESMYRALLPYVFDLESKAVQWVNSGEEAFIHLRWLIEGRGHSMEEWAMDVPIAGRFSFYRFINGRSTKVESQTPIHHEIALELTKKDQDLRQEFVKTLGMSYVRFIDILNKNQIGRHFGLSSKSLKLCKRLQEKSIKELTF